MRQRDRQTTGGSEDRPTCPVLASPYPSVILLCAQVAQKTSTYMVGRQEAETEVIIDRLIEREGSKEKALLFVVCQIPTEVKVS